MCAEVVREAAADSGAGDALLRRAGSLGVVDIASRRWSDPGALVAARLGIAPAAHRAHARRRRRPAAARQRRGDADRRRRARRRRSSAAPRRWRRWPARCATAASRTGRRSTRARSPRSVLRLRPLPGQRGRAGRRPDRAGDGLPAVRERAVGARRRDDRGAPPAARRAVGELRPGLRARTRSAWLPGARSAEQIATPGKGNRLVSLPYTKLLNSNIQTDQAAALLLCSAGTAQALGIPREQWVFPHASAHAHEHWFVSERAGPRRLARDRPRRARRAARTPAARSTRSTASTSTRAFRAPCRSPAPSSASTPSPTSGR